MLSRGFVTGNDPASVSVDGSPRIQSDTPFLIECKTLLFSHTADQYDNDSEAVEWLTCTEAEASPVCRRSYFTVCVSESELPRKSVLPLYVALM